MKAGRLRHKLTLQVRQDLRDTFGQPRPEWTDFAVVWGEMRPLRAREYFAAQLAESDATVVWSIRYVAGVTTRHRLLFGERIFDINSVQDVGGRSRELELICTEKI